MHLRAKRMDEDLLVLLVPVIHLVPVEGELFTDALAFVEIILLSSHGPPKISPSGFVLSGIAAVLDAKFTRGLACGLGIANGCVLPFRLANESSHIDCLMT